MKQFIDIENRERKEHFDFFWKFSDPFWGLTLNIDCTIAYQRAKAGQNVIHYSEVPWISFTSLSHASHTAFRFTLPSNY